MCGSETTTTVWEGTAFRCQANSDEIALRHSQFTNQNQPESGDCNGGSLVAYAIGVEEQNCYISQLNVTVNTRLNGTTVVCAFEALGINELQIVNTSMVAITTGNT